MLSTPRLLLTGCGSPASQNFLQALRLAPEPFAIVGADANRYHLEWGDLDAAYVSPLTSDPTYLDFLEHLCRAEHIDFIHGQPDWEVAFLSAHRHLVRARTFLPDPQAIALGQDKFASCSLWWQAGLRSDPPLLVRSQLWLRRAASTLGLPFWLRATAGVDVTPLGACWGKTNSRRSRALEVMSRPSCQRDWNANSLPGR